MKKTHTLEELLSLLVFALFAFLACCVYSSRSSSNSATPYVAKQTARNRREYEAIKAAIRDRLLNPSAAVFPQFDQVTIKTNPATRQRVAMGVVRSGNAYGDIVADHFVVTYSADAADFEVLNVDFGTDHQKTSRAQLIYKRK